MKLKNFMNGMRIILGNHYFQLGLLGASLSSVSEKVPWDLIALHTVAIFAVGLSYWTKFTTHVKYIGITILFPIYLIVVSNAIAS
jgi:hypothetical protein